MAIKTINSNEDFTRLQIREILRFHGVSFSLSSHIGGPPLTSDFWKSFRKGLVNEVNLDKYFNRRYTYHRGHVESIRF